MGSIYRYFRPIEWDYLFPAEGTGTLRFTPIQETNDPHEGKNNILGVARTKHDFFTTIEKIVQDEKQRAVFDFLKRIDEKEFIDKIYETAQFFHKELRSRLQNYGIFSATTHKNSIVMWEHYSVRHTGFMVEFNKEHSLFNTSHGLENIFGVWNDVNYVDEMPRKYLTELFKNPSAMYCTKHNDWSYEREVRVIYNLDEYIFQKNNQMRGCTEITDNLIKSVTFGCNSFCEGWTSRLKANKQYMHIPLYKASVQDDIYDLKYEQI